MHSKLWKTARAESICFCGRLHCWFHQVNDDFFPAASHTKAHAEPSLVYILSSPGDTVLHQTDWAVGSSWVSFYFQPCAKSNLLCYLIPQSCYMHFTIRITINKYDVVSFPSCGVFCLIHQLLLGIQWSREIRWVMRAASIPEMKVILGLWRDNDNLHGEKTCRNIKSTNNTDTVQPLKLTLITN